MSREIRVINGSGTDIVGKVYYTTTHIGIKKAIDYLTNTYTTGGKRQGRILLSAGVFYINDTTNTDNYAQRALKIPSDIELCGEGESTILRSTSDLNLAHAGVLSTSTSQHVVIKNLKIEASTAEYGIYACACGTSFGAGKMDGATSRYDSASVGSTHPNEFGIKIENCTIQDVKVYGIYLVSSHNCQIINCTLSTNHGHAIFLENSTRTSVKNNFIYNNLDAAIYIFGHYSSNIICNNIIQNNYRGILSSPTNFNSITNNIIQNNSINNISLVNTLINIESQGNVVSGNIMQNSGGTGISICNTNGEVVTNNIINNNCSYGIELTSTVNGKDCTEQIVSNNIITHNNKEGMSTCSGNKEFVITNNISRWNNGAGINVFGSRSVAISNICISNYSSNFLNNLTDYSQCFNNIP